MRKRHAELGEPIGVENKRLINDGDVLEIRKTAPRSSAASVRVARWSTAARSATSRMSSFVTVPSSPTPVSSSPSSSWTATRARSSLGSRGLIQRGFMGEDEIDKLHRRRRLRYALSQRRKELNDLSNASSATRVVIRELTRGGSRSQALFSQHHGPSMLLPQGDQPQAGM